MCVEREGGCSVSKVVGRLGRVLAVCKRLFGEWRMVLKVSVGCLKCVLVICGVGGGEGGGVEGCALCACVILMVMRW